MAGQAIRKLSSRSRKPPCPGMMWLVSLTPTVRLSSDSERSPSVPKIGTMSPIPIQPHRGSGMSLEFIGKYWPM